MPSAVAGRPLSGGGVRLVQVVQRIVTVISGPQPAPAARDLFPDDFRELTTNPSFLFFVLHAG